MKSMYGRQFVIMAGMILISFFLLGAAFITLSYQYTVREKQSSMERNANYIADAFSTNIRALAGSQQDFYKVNVDALALVSDAYVFICQSDGEIIYSSDGSADSNLGGVYTMPTSVVQQVKALGAYGDMSDLNGLFPERRYVAGAPITLTTGRMEPGQGLVFQPELLGLVFVAAETSSITEMWRAFASIFFFTSIVVLLIAFITSSVTSLKQTKPLKEMAEVVRRFGLGEMDARVECQGRCDEVGDLAEAFNSMADSLAKSEARRSEFVANISHELKTPMTTIAGFAEGILDGTIPAAREREYLKIISAETRRLSRLVRKMLDLSRLQSAEHVTAQEQFDVSEIALRVLVSLETKINGRRLDVDTNLPENPVLVWGDPDAITQVVYNLLDNAIKFSIAESTLGISVTTKAGKAYVSISNHGETIPPGELTMIFDRFHKTDHSRSEDREGVGLGLYIVKTILNNHKETIVATSQDGVTEFTFTLTLA